MDKRAAAFTALFFALVSLGFRHAAPGVAGTAKASPCGAPLTGALREPQRVDVWTLPVDAGGRNELIVGAHKDRDRYCYRYQLDGTQRTGAPVIVVRRGERFDLRVANDITAQSRGEFVASNALPPCMPMAMQMKKNSNRRHDARNSRRAIRTTNDRDSGVVIAR